MKITIAIFTLAFGFTSCTNVVAPVSCTEEGTCKYVPYMKNIIQEQMCVDNGEETKCTSYYQRNFAYIGVKDKGDGYNSYGFNRFGINKEGQSITQFHSECKQIIEKGNPNTYLNIPTCHLEYGSATPTPLKIGSYGKREATVEESIIYYDNYNKPSKSVSHYVPIAKYLVGLDSTVFDQNSYGLSLEYIEKEPSKILSAKAKCESEQIEPPTMPINECHLEY